MEVVELTGARQVYTVHGFTEDFARSLRRKESGRGRWRLTSSSRWRCSRPRQQ
jgi:hypothetical protein